MADGLEHQDGRRELFVTIEAELADGSGLDNLVLDVHAARTWSRRSEVVEWVQRRRQAAS